MSFSKLERWHLLPDRDWLPRAARGHHSPPEMFGSGLWLGSLGRGPEHKSSLGIFLNTPLNDHPGSPWTEGFPGSQDFQS